MNTHHLASLKPLLSEWPFLLVALCLVHMLQPAFQADFALIDDHEIISLLGREGRLTMGQVIPLIRDYAIEKAGRFRPGYYTLKVLEAYVADGHANCWHVHRCLLAIVSAGALYCLVRCLLPPFAAAIVALLFFAGRQNEIWIRLGPNETYGVPFCLVGMAWVALWVARDRWRPTTLLPGFTLIWLAGFMKESFIPVLPGVLAFLYIIMPIVLRHPVLRPGSLTFADSLTLVLLLLGIGIQVGLVILVLKKYGHVYGASFTATAFVGAIKPTMKEYARQSAWFLAVVVALLRPLLGTGPGREFRSWFCDMASMVGLLLAGAFLILVPQWAILGRQPLAGRYLIPGNLFVVFSVSVALYFSFGKSSLQGPVLVKFALLSVFLTIVLFRGRETRQAAHWHAYDTRRFQARVQQIVQLKEAHPDLPLLFCSEDPDDWEALYSVAIYLSVKLPEGERPILASLPSLRGKGVPPKERLPPELASELEHVQKALKSTGVFSGRPGFDLADDECIAVMFHSFTDYYAGKYRISIFGP